MRRPDRRPTDQLVRLLRSHLAGRRRWIVCDLSRKDASCACTMATTKVKLRQVNDLLTTLLSSLWHRDERKKASFGRFVASDNFIFFS